MSDKTPQEQRDSATSAPVHKRKGKAALVPFTVMLDPADLATAQMIADASKRSVGDIMRELLSYGLAHKLEQAFAPAATQSATPPTEAHATPTAQASPEEPEPNPSRRRNPVSAALDPNALAVLEALAGNERGKRSNILRRAIAEGLAVAEENPDD